MRPKVIALIVRIWQGSDGVLKASVRPSHGGPTQYFSSLEALKQYLEQTQERIEINTDPTKGLR
ncbi:hypothetical protein [Meiothermus taiwanensis]|uniref:Uncharacterized protein n=2 Tax=Meiothermus taiwanensis TaxID=172827 RepID=A0A399DTM1_9DEIN|nr:hypothetical protein [Meiothermus taiwanensis]AWR86588.1 hypothetical protein Mtai_v1c13460 [Meiothermus taiwanensis WR-220]KIQ55604.1 hypothetical protein SY28_02745 [Meiothermus taiwanensis]RIH75406.1 hypothetical protein Mcate_02242 [Meiothermus taiwanensis]